MAQHGDKLTWVENHGNYSAQIGRSKYAVLTLTTSVDPGETGYKVAFMGRTLLNRAATLDEAKGRGVRMAVDMVREMERALSMIEVIGVAQ